MSHARELRFEALEARNLLSGAAHVAPSARHAAAATALVLNGTLNVDNSASSTTTDVEGDTITSTPVKGKLGALGEVHGTWTESADEFGDYLGPDTLQIRAANGTFVVAFSEQRTSGRHRIAGGAVTYQAPQIASNGTGAYARTTESGLIQFTTNSAHTSVANMTLSTS
jgi:hypothetical protein